MYVELVFVVFFVCGCRCFTTASWSLTQTERFGMVVMAKMLRDGHSDNGTIQCMFLFFWRNSPYNLLMNVVSICFNKRVTHNFLLGGSQCCPVPIDIRRPSSRGALQDGCAKQSRVDEALKLLEEMKQEGAGRPSFSGLMPVFSCEEGNPGFFSHPKNVVPGHESLNILGPRLGLFTQSIRMVVHRAVSKM